CLEAFLLAIKDNVAEFVIDVRHAEQPVWFQRRDKYQVHVGHGPEVLGAQTGADWRRVRITRFLADADNNSRHRQILIVETAQHQQRKMLQRLHQTSNISKIQIEVLREGRIVEIRVLENRTSEQRRAACS